MKKTILCLPILAMGFAAGCSGSGANDLYIDRPSFTENNITVTVSINEGYSFIVDKQHVSLRITLLSTNPKQTQYSIASPLMIRERDGAEYSPSATISTDKTFTLACDIAQSTNYSWNLPDSYEETNYYFSFKGNGKTVKYFLREMPDEYRKKVDVHYVIDGVEIETRSLPEGKRIALYDWVSDDYIYGCNSWYSDAAMTTRASEKIPSNGMTIYGTKKVILQYNTPSAIGVAYVSDYNFVPSTGEIIIPREYTGRPISGILAGAFNGGVDGMREIYIPKGVRVSESYNFVNCLDLKTVHFEGNQAEWAAYNQAKFKSSVEVVFNSYK